MNQFCCLIFTKKETIRTLSPDWTYTCVAFADEGVKDLDLKIYILNEATDTWEFVSEEKSTESYAIVNVTPEKSAKYKFEVIVYKYNEGYDVAKYGLMLVHK